MDNQLVAPLSVPDIESLPTSWRWASLASVCAGVFDCPHSTPELTSSGPLVVRSQDIRSGVLRVDQAARVSQATYLERIRRAEPVAGDILYSREGTYFGIAAEVPRDTRLCLGQRIVLLRPNAQRVHHRFLRLWLNSSIMATYASGFYDGSVAQRLNVSTIRNLPVPLPCMDEQKAIARVLGVLDDKIELNRRMNQTLEALARAMFKSWFVDFDPVVAKASGKKPVGMSPKTAALFPDRFQDSNLGPIPKGWRVGRVGDEFGLTMGQSPPGDTYNEEGNGEPFFQGRTDFTFRFPARRVYCTAPTRFADPQDTLVSVRAPVGDINMAIVRCAVGRGVAAVRHKSGSRSLTYYAMWGLSDAFAMFDGDGTLFGSIGKTDFAGIQFVSPPDDLLAHFNASASPLDDRIERNERQSASLVSLRDALLPQLMSGELRVGQAERLVSKAV